MKIKLLAIGKTDDTQLQQLIDTYKNRLKHYINFETEWLPDIKNAKSLNEFQQKEKEGELILKKLQPNDTLLLLDENGTSFSSVDFSVFIQKKIEQRHKTISFCNWWTIRIF